MRNWINLWKQLDHVKRVEIAFAAAQTVVAVLALILAVSSGSSDLARS